MSEIGFIGIGAMGSSIAGRLVGHHPLVVNDRNPDATAGLVALGATSASLTEVARRCDTIVLCLPGPAQVRSLLLEGDDPLVDHLRSGTVVVDTTTSIPTLDSEIIAALASRGVAFADSPIAGGVRKAQDGTATLMVGADHEVFARIQPLLTLVTSNVIHVGPVGTGHAMKLVNNLLNACNRFAALEMIQLAERAGVSRETALQVLNSSSGRNYATEYTFPQLLSGSTYSVQGFTLELMLKDLRLANELASDVGLSTPIGSLAQGLAESAVERFGPQADQSQMMWEWYEA